MTGNLGGSWPNTQSRAGRASRESKQALPHSLIVQKQEQNELGQGLGWSRRCGRLHLPKRATAVSPIPYTLTQRGKSIPPAGGGVRVPFLEPRQAQDCVYQESMVEAMGSLRPHQRETCPCPLAFLDCPPWRKPATRAEVNLPETTTPGTPQPVGINGQPRECAVMDGWPGCAFG